MASLIVDEKDIRFVLFEQFKIQELCENEKFADFSDEVFEMILEQAHKYTEDVLFPLNQEGDKNGARFENGKVFSTAGTKEAYQGFVEGGWLTPCEDYEVGGQGLPHSIMTATHEMFFSNFPFMCYVNLTHDAAKLVEIFGTEDQKKTYMEKMYAGEYTGTMCLSEPDAGSDVGAIRCKAVKRDDGNYSIQGSKIFITNGEHDISGNIVHLLLARIEGDPPGTKGLSLFIVPKNRINDDGSTGEQNDVVCTGIEHKMGLNASPTTSLSFGDNGECIGYLLGDQGEGIRIMFHMMNSSRLEVGIWGLTTCSMSYLHSLEYARERKQGQDAINRDSEAQVPIIMHPDIRNSLLMMKAYVEGIRAMIYYCGYAMDRMAVAADDGERKKWSKLVDLFIPVCKAYPTEKGVDLASTAIQLHGGYGYTQEYPVEQFMRDAKVACIFEGTTGIQAMDFALRKLSMSKGTVFSDFISSMDDVINKANDISELEKYADQLNKTKTAISTVPPVLAEKGGEGKIYYSFLKATPLLEAMGDVIVSWFLLWGAVIASEKLDALCTENNADTPEKKNDLIKNNNNASFLAGKIQSAKFFIGNILPVTDGKIEAIKWGDTSAWDIDEQSFGI